MTTNEKILPTPVQPTLADIEVQVARIRAGQEAKRAYAYKDAHDNFDNEKLEKALPYDNERTIGRIAIIQAFDTQDTYTLAA